MSVHSVVGRLGDLEQQVEQVLQDDPMHRWQQQHQQLQATQHRRGSTQSWKINAKCITEDKINYDPWSLEGYVCM